MKILIDMPDNLYYDIRTRPTNKYSLLEHIILNGEVIQQCNKCKYYEGVHNCQGHAPCSYHNIGGVMWDWQCSQFEEYKREQK